MIIIDVVSRVALGCIYMYIYSTCGYNDIVIVSIPTLT